MKKIFICLVLFAFVLSGCSAHSSSQKTQSKDYKKILNNAKTIRIEEDPISVWKHYDILVDDTKVAEVTGKFITAFGDEFEMKDMNGNVLTKEKQMKRYGLKFNRMAVFYDEKGNITGYIGEQTMTKLFSIGYYFHFLNKDKKQIGISDQVNFSAFKQNNFIDNDNHVDYFVKENFSLFHDTYDVTIHDKENIPLYQAILMTCIEDAIKDAQEKKDKEKKKKH
jgi:hypothetical protein